MKWFQAFPYPTPPDRAYVNWRQSQVERVAVENHAYGEAMMSMAHRHPEGFWMLEWDIALNLDDMETLEAAARYQPEHIHVVSYNLHYQTTESELVNWNSPIASVQLDYPVTRSTKSIMNCDYPGLGIIWFPSHIIKAFDGDNFWPEMRYPDADATFWRKVGKQSMNIVQGVHPTHLHW